MSHRNLYQRTCLLAPLAAFAFGSLSSCSLSSSNENGSVFTMDCVPVEDDTGALDALLPDDFMLEEGEVVRRQTYSIDPMGKFTVARTIEKEVGFLGVRLKSLDDQIAEEFGLEPFSGVLVRSVEKDSPASAAGLVPGDVILRFNANTPRSAEQLESQIERMAAGTTVQLSVRREDPSRTTEMELALGGVTRIVRSKTFQRELPVLDDIDRSGMRLLEIPADLRPIVFKESEGPAEPALVVSEILPGGPAFFSDIRLNDRIATVDGVRVNTIEDYEIVMARFAVGDRVDIERQPSSDSELTATSVRLEENAREEGGFNLIGLLKYRHRPASSRFSMISSILFDSSANHSIHKHGGRFEHETRSSWGIALNLIHFDSTPSRKTFRLAWILPFSFGS